MIAVFGGTFDPPTLAHRQIIQDLSARFGTLIVLPSYSPFYKSEPTASYYDRLDMLSRLELPSNVLISSAEKSNYHRTGGRTFSLLSIIAETLGVPKNMICPVIGADQAIVIDTWYESSKLLNMFNVHYIDRSGQTGEMDPRLTRIDIEVQPISSTLVRNNIKAGLTIENLVPDEIIETVKEKYHDQMP